MKFKLRNCRNGRQNLQGCHIIYFLGTVFTILALEHSLSNQGDFRDLRLAPVEACKNCDASIRFAEMLSVIV